MTIKKKPIVVLIDWIKFYYFQEKTKNVIDLTNSEKRDLWF